MKIEFNNIPNKAYIVLKNNNLLYKLFLKFFKTKIVWESRSVATVATIVARYKNEDYILLAKRGKGAADHQGLWNMPCGYLDYNERTEQCCVREVFEETGVYLPKIMLGNKILKFDMLQPYYVKSDINSNRQNVSLYYGLYFETDKLPETTDKFSEPNEIEEIKWVKIPYIDKYIFAFNHKIEIKKYYKSLFE